jgi:hypothetical protein
VEQMFHSLSGCSVWLVPVVAMWGVACLYWGRFGGQAAMAQVVYFTCLFGIAGLTLRTVMANDGCWLIHTSTLGVMIVFGSMLRPSSDEALAY